MKQLRKDLIADMQKVINSNPRKQIFAALLANVAEQYVLNVFDDIKKNKNHE